MRTTRIEQYVSAIEAYGYAVTSEPIPGMENEYADDLAETLKKIEATIASIREYHGFRGMSKNAIKCLHRSLPEPAWAIEVR